MFYISVVLTAGWFCFMTYLSHQNGEQTHKTSEGLAEHLQQYLPESVFAQLHGLLRQAAHVVVFLILAILLLNTVSLKSHDARIWGIAVVGIAVWAWVDEAAKPWIQGRHFSWYDVRLNLLGLTTGTIIFIMFWLVSHQH